MTDTYFENWINSGGEREVRNSDGVKTEKTELEGDLVDAFSQRSQILQTKLGILAAQVLERMKIRSENLGAILDQEQELADRIMNREGIAEGSPDLDQLRQQRGFLMQEKRSQSVDCWRDLTHVIRDLLNTWEDLEQTKTRDKLLADTSSSDFSILEANNDPISDENPNANYYQ